MQRESYNNLLAWKSQVGHKPLVLTGAPMVGKTYLAKEFGRGEYQNVAHFSFLEHPVTKSFFRNQSDIARILRQLSSLFRKDIIPGQTLLILDDIQYCPEAVESLREFDEDAPGLDVIAVGTFAPGDGAFDRIPASFVDRMTLLPMSYKEFLLAMNQKYLYEIVSRLEWDSIRALCPKLEDFARQYCFCGGMPAAVKAYCENPDAGPYHIREIQNGILNALETRMSKRQLDVWKAVFPRMREENLKFMYGDIKKGARASEYREALEQLETMGLVYRTYKVSTVSMPMDFYRDPDSFRLYPMDPGLAAARLGLEPEALLVDSDVLVSCNGMFARMMAASQLRKTGLPVFHYGKTGSIIEVDFLVQTTGKIIPLEVRTRHDGNSKSLKTFVSKHPGRKGVRASLEPMSDYGWMENIPVYCVEDYICKEN